MSGATKAIKRRIGSVKNTHKITKAMELVAASKMRKAVEAALGTREYAQHAWDVLQHISEAERDTAHPLLKKRSVHKVLMVVVTSNRGLCGGLNSNIFKQLRDLVTQPKALLAHRNGKGVLEFPQTVPDDLEVDFITVGKKGERHLARQDKNILASFIDVSDTPQYVEIQPVAQMILDAYSKKKYDKVVVVFSDFVSAIVQQPKVRQLLPISAIDLEKTMAEMDRFVDTPLLEEKERGELQRTVDHTTEYTFEPDTATVLDEILPRLVEVQVFQSVLESSASEHSSRMMAMRNASDSAKEMIDDLTFSLNRARQAGITQEIAEISSGMAAIT